MPPERPHDRNEPTRAAMLRELPRVDDLASELVLRGSPDPLPHELATALARLALAEAREALLAQHELIPPLSRAIQHLTEWQRPHLRPVINATGIVIHTNLGRAPLPSESLPAPAYSNLEFDLAEGRRGSRHAGISPLLATLSGAEAGLAVNNCAAALILALTALKRHFNRHEVIISRGELVEIGGAFRIPEILDTAGTTLREVGTTNRTRTSDYERAISPATLAILRVHPSNFEILGFCERPDARDLITLSRKADLPFIYDLGSDLLGAPNPIPQPSPWAAELDAKTAIAAGADLVLFSGDKLLGGPQSGLALGRRLFIDAMTSHPLMRALRLDKLGLGALEHVLRQRLLGQWRTIPTLAMLHLGADELGARARRLARDLEARGVLTEPVPTEDKVGGGSYPSAILKGVGLALITNARPSEVARRLRTGDPPVVPIIDGDRVIIALRTLSEADESRLIDALVRALDIPESTF